MLTRATRMKATQENLKSVTFLMNWDAAKVIRTESNKFHRWAKRQLKSGSGPQRLSTRMKEPTNYGTQSFRAAPGCMKNHQTAEGAPPMASRFNIY